MSRMKKILLLAGLGAVSFGGAMAVSLLTGSKGTQEIPEGAPAQLQDAPLFADSTIRKLEKLNAPESELQKLTRLVNRQRREIRRQRQRLHQRKQRIDLARQELAAEAERLKQMRTELAAAIPALKQAKAELQAQRIRIAREEKENLRRNALIFERMDTTEAAETLTRMFSDGRQKDVVLTLRYMSEKSAAKVLDEVPDKGIRAQLFEEMKRIQEEG